MRTIRLDGEWKLTFYPQEENRLTHPDELATSGLSAIPAAVPGNVELDLQRAGLLEDPLVYDRIKLLKRYETYEWWYERSFTVQETDLQGGRVELWFGGVDCLADYWLDGRYLGSSDNMFIEHRFDISAYIVAGHTHTLAVRLSSPVLHAMNNTVYDPSSHALPVNYEQLWVRKAAHSYGWDIFGRAVSAGLWRSVELRCHEKNEIVDLYAAATSVSQERAVLQVHYQLTTEARNVRDGLRLRLTGVCGEAKFTTERDIRFVYGHFELTVDRPQLWWPRGYGEAALYDVTTELLLDGEVLAVRHDTIGIRTLELERTDVTTVERPGQFLFRVNGVPILIKGTNWVPLDPFHSRDAAKYEEAVQLAADLNCNMMRCWGGGVYEDHAFFALCDRMGILIWQDFAMACAVYPQAPAFQEAIRAEAVSVVRKLRGHPSIAVWCGDNECDEFYLLRGLDPNNNVLTRRVLPEAVFQCDPYRPFVPSSPYVSPEAFRLRSPDVLPERHLWGTRDYFKSPYYQGAKAHFAGEMGYHGCPGRSSIERFIEGDHVWPWQDNEQWLLHATDPVGGTDSMYRFRLKLMADQIGELFGSIPDDRDDFIIASQISQAEAVKYFVERVRLHKWRTTGVLWWNLLDGWPQFSDAVVDYYRNRKLAYWYIRRVQQPVCLMADEPEDWMVRIKAGNDSNAPASGGYRVRLADSGETLLEGRYEVEANGLRELGAIRTPRSMQGLLLIEWDNDGRSYGNHYLVGTPGFSFDKYKEWLRAIAALPDGFDAASIGR